MRSPSYLRSCLSRSYLNFAAQLWDEVKPFAFLGILQYYRPAVIMGSGEYPTGDVLVLLGIATVGLVAGSQTTSHRSICTT